MKIAPIAVWSLLAAALMLSSCQEEQLANDAAINRDVIAFDVDMTDPALTRSDVSDPVESLMISFSGIEDSIPLSVSVSDMPDPAFPSPMDATTKGTPITTENLGDEFASFAVDAKEVANTSGFTFSMSGVEVSYDETRSPKWNTDRPYYWPQLTNDVDFWFYSPKTLSTEQGGSRTVPAVNFTEKKVTFDYEMSHGQANSVESVDAVKQQDLLFAHQTWNKEQGVVQVHFDHALSGVRFVAGIVGSCVINSITLKDVVTKASCVYAPLADDKFQWTLSSVAEDVNDLTQTFEAELYANDETGVRQDVTDAYGLKERTFMVIPQDFDGIVVTIAYTINGTQHYSSDFTLPKFPVTQPDNPTEWIPGKMYTYVINNIGEELIINVTDQVVGLTKTDLQISNTSQSNVKCYIRACVLGNWYKEGKIVAPWSTNSGTFDATFPTTVGMTVNNWTLASDGYYYYKYPVYPGQLTGQTETDADGDPLFGQYTAPASPAVNGAQLKVQVVAQGVKWDASMSSVKDAWGTDIASYLSATDKE